MTAVAWSPVLGLRGLAMAFAMYRHVVAQPSGTAAVVDISSQPLTALAFISGGLCSMLAGFFGMTAATRANVRTANAAKEVGRDKALSIAFYGGLGDGALHRKPQHSRAGRLLPAHPRSDRHQCPWSPW